MSIGNTQSHSSYKKNVCIIVVLGLEKSAVVQTVEQLAGQMRKTHVATLIGCLIVTSDNGQQNS